MHYIVSNLKYNTNGILLSFMLFFFIRKIKDFVRALFSTGKFVYEILIKKDIYFYLKDIVKEEIEDYKNSPFSYILRFLIACLTILAMMYFKSYKK